MEGLIPVRRARLGLWGAWGTRRNHSTTPCDLFFRILCATRGLRSGFKKGEKLRYAVAVGWTFIHFVGIVIFVGSTIHRAPGFDIESFAYFTRLAGVTIFVCTELMSAMQFFRMAEELEEMLQKSGRRLCDFTVNFTCLALLLLQHIHLIFRDVRILPLKAYFRISEYSRTCFFMIYNDIIMDLQNIQKNILFEAKDLATQDEEVLKKKWS